MIGKNLSFRLLSAVLLGGMSVSAWSQLVIQDNFTGTSSSFNWASFNGACLTAGTGGGTIPACKGYGYYSETLVGGNSSAFPGSPDPAGSGALRFTNGYPGGYGQNGAIVSNFTFPTNQGLHVTFTTVTYRGDSGGGGSDGADGISFYLMDGAQAPGIGAWGGSLAFSCSNSNTPHGGLLGGYLGLGIDEFGNFLNQGDNTATGWGYQPGRIGLRGAGSITWGWLTANYPADYPASTPAGNRDGMVQATCSSGKTPSGIAVQDYAAIPSAYSVLPSTVQIANESAQYRPQANPITYDLQITPAGLLSLSYSTGGAFQQVISGQDINHINGSQPAGYRFGFAGSTGGDTNIHEILCFKATQFQQSSSSAGLNQQQASKVTAGTQVYLAFYDPNNWTGSVTSNNVLFNASTQVVSISSVANWDASCVLTGVASGSSCAATGATGAIAPELPVNRQMLTWNGSAGVPFEWGSLTGGQRSTLDAGDPIPTADRLNFLRGDRTNEINALGVGEFRARGSVLGDIIDSSPTPVGPPSANYRAVWADASVVGASLPENSGQTYPQFAAANQSRSNIVYVGSNDGFLHAFRAGSFDSSGNFVSNAGTPNDGYEIMAYMPGAVVNTIHSTSPSADFSNIHYGHNFFVDGNPGTGDLFYGGVWHTWVVGGLGAGGSAIYALDVTNPSSFNEGTAASTVIGEWTPANITCANFPNCGQYLGNTYGTPMVRRLHNGMWAVIFGNGLGSSKGDAGIFIMTVDPNSGAKTFYYLSTGSTGTNDGIAYTAPVDLDNDNITDFIYAGDVNGNVWRFDVTSSQPSNWITSFFNSSNATAPPSPLFTTPSGQPITSKVVVVAHSQSNSSPRLLIEFGTGQQIPLTNTSPTTYASGTQALYGVWDWNLIAWNTHTNLKYAAATAPQSILFSTLQQQTITGSITSGAGNQFRQVSSNPVCWALSSQCGSGNTQFGWYLNLPGAGEQVIYNPVVQLGAFTINTTIPAVTNTLQCTATAASGWTFSIQPSNGGSFPQSVFADTVNGFNTYNKVAAELTNGTGSPSFIAAGGHYFMLSQTSAPGNGDNGVAGGGGNGPGGPPAPGPGGAWPYNGTGQQGNRVSWRELR